MCPVQRLEPIPTRVVEAQAAHAALLERVAMLEAAGSPAAALPTDTVLGLISAALAPTHHTLNALSAEVAALKAGASALPPDNTPAPAGAAQSGSAGAELHAPSGAPDLQAEAPAPPAGPAEAGAAPHGEASPGEASVGDSGTGATQASLASLEREPDGQPPASAGPSAAPSTRPEPDAGPPGWQTAAGGAGAAAPGADQAGLAAALATLHARLASAEAALQSLADARPGAGVAELDALAERVSGLHSAVAHQEVRLDALCAHESRTQRRPSGAGDAPVAAAAPLGGQAPASVPEDAEAGGPASGGCAQEPRAAAPEGSAGAASAAQGSASMSVSDQQASVLPSCCCAAALLVKCCAIRLPAMHNCRSMSAFALCTASGKITVQPQQRCTCSV